jgi:hemoglobin-like flavoprotein
MAANEKIMKALESAVRYLGGSLSALGSGDKAFADSIWHVAAELEYALFLFSLMFKDEDDASRWKPNPENKKIGTEEMLATVRELLGESKKALVGEDLMNAYKRAYMARHYVFKIQEDLARKKREASKK